MARLGSFSRLLDARSWFDKNARAEGWFDEELIPEPSGGAIAYSLTCDAGSFTISGQDATLRRGYALNCEAGAFVISGQDAIFVYTPGSGAIAYTLDCEAGAFVISGQDASLVYTSGSFQDTHDGYWTRKWLNLKKRLETKEEIQEQIEAVQEEISSVKAEVATKVAMMPKYRKTVQYQDYSALIRKLEAEIQRLDDELEDELLLL